MAYALLAHTAKEGSVDTTVTTPAINTTGATLIVQVIGFNVNAQNPSLSSFTDSAGNLWSMELIPGFGKSQSSTRTTVILWCANPTTSATHTFTMTGTTLSEPSIAVLAFSGIPGFREKLVGAIGSSVTSLSPGSITPTQDNELLIAGICLPTAATVTINGGFTITDQVGGTVCQRVAAAYLIQTSAAVAAPSWSFSSNSGSAEMIAFRLGASASGQRGMAFFGAPA